MADHSLPDYEPMLESYHRAFERELRRMIGCLPIQAGSLILEVACGDGIYTRWVGELAGPSGQVVGLDVLRDYLEVARRREDASTPRPRSEFVLASIDRLPFGDGTFDVVWCAQSLFSLPDPLASVRNMARLVKPGGLVAVLEDDTLHQLILPWPVPLEIAIRAAEWEQRCEASSNPDKFYVGRNLAGLFREAGLVDLEIHSFASSRIGPFSGPTREFLRAYLDQLRDRVIRRLEPKDRTHLLRLLDPNSSEFMLDQPDLQITVIDHVIQGFVAVPT